MRPANRTDDDRVSVVIQREVGIALRLSFEAVTSDPLPERMALLLLRLALAESLGLAIEEDGPKEETGRNED
ncbi:MAG: hypothetical protein FJX45_06600 [Alphaproteobacteria bacterium]|nr:hypothetical protein [Alphaproteobacteria bacterium]MBM3651754.1 hypothetical protein [Alphaproteobacteria bacterium]